jgi:coenzyme F420 hydrogenase subunit delta
LNSFIQNHVWCLAAGTRCSVMTASASKSSPICNNHHIPEHAACLDVGTSIRDFLFDLLLAAKKPRQMIIVDAAQCEGKRPGEVFEIDIDEINPKKTSDFSLHQFPTTNMLKELKTATDMNIRVLVGQTEAIPDEVAPGLSPALTAAVPEASRLVVKMIGREAT